jgi:very-short-patch-repair endonuclease
MSWTEADLQKLKDKGFSVEDKKSELKEILHTAESIKIQKVSVEKNTIEFILISLKQQGLISDFTKEYQFDIIRKFRFDWSILDLKLAIEYEGIVSEKSRHTSLIGFSNDCTKYNLAIANGWRVLRYTALNYQELHNDLNKIINEISILQKVSNDDTI